MKINPLLSEPYGQCVQPASQGIMCSVQGYVNLIMHITMIRTQHPADLGSWRNCRFCSQLRVINMRRRVSYSWGALKSSTLFQSRYCSLQLHSDCYYSGSGSGPRSLETIGVISAEVIWSVYTAGGLDGCTIASNRFCVLSKVDT